ncbi:protein OSB1, mitochondrial-like [Phoenix dactylifera]|uniref:Protein OSB1, mitochondrial-like n=1 Tax=Phoenix dactylifera TaxID=42345 RepID=A0A8B7C6I5_PHODC|nr:protein OSB1, mitochondrial-like [Phoenix dactylifera]
MGSSARLFSSVSSSLRSSLRPFSSASPPLPGVESLSFFSHDGAGESPAYRRSMLRPPPTVRPWWLLWNSCSFIGTVRRPVNRFAGFECGAYTFLEVDRPSRDSDSSSIQILLAMWDELAEISLRHLKPNDFIYVRGPLGCYEKVNASGIRETFFKIFVQDLNYVQQNNQNDTSHKLKSSEEEESSGSTSGASYHEEEYGGRLHLWQVFFANPYEWWDNRQSKPYSGCPDFKHKDTRECLWLRPDDPPWVRRQLELYDSNMGNHQRNVSGWSEVHQWRTKDLV